MPKITADLEVKSDKWSSGIGKAEKDVKSFVDKAQSSFKNLTMQGGASGFASTFMEGAKAAETFATGIRTGESAQKMLGDAINKVPIVGQFKQAGEAIGELISGQKAARIEAEKLTEHVTKMAAGYREIAALRAGFGKYGTDKANIDVDNNENKAVGDLVAQRSKLNADLQHNKTKNWFWDSAAEKEEMKRQEQELKLFNDRIKAEHDKAAQEHKDVKRGVNQKELEYDRDMEAKGAAFKAMSEERSKKAQGDALGARVIATRAAAEAEKKANLATLDDTKLEELEGGKDGKLAQHHRKKVAEDNARIDADAAATIDDLQKEDARRKQELAADNEEKLKEITATGNIERLKMKDEATNAEHAKTGDATRSHLAEQAQIQEEYRKQVADLEKKARDPNGGLTPELKKQSMDAIGAERDSKLGLLNEKSKNEQVKNAEDIAKETRKAWEAAGDPADKYKAKLEDINEQYAKLHDKGLRDKQLKDLDTKTLDEFKKLNPDHQPSVEMYGRTSSNKYLTVGGGGEDIARQQFEAIKQQTKTQAEDSNRFRDIWNYFQKLTTGAVTEIGINAAG